MIIFYDPNNGNQVMAVYSHDTESTVWEDQGFLRLAILGKEFQKKISRDTAIVVTMGSVSDVFPRVNSVQPTPDPKAIRVGELEAQLAVSDLTTMELNELARLERGV